MLKELFVAIILGALLGFGITGGYFSLKKGNSSKTSLPPATQEIPISGTITDGSTPTPTADSSDQSNTKLPKL